MEILFGTMIFAIIMWLYIEIFNSKDTDDIKQVAQFEKINKLQFQHDCNKFMKDSSIKNGEGCEKIYNNIKLPERATTGSAGYDFFSPVSFILQPGETIKFPTGIKVDIDTGWVLKLYPRSSIGFKYETMLSNTVGIVDSDYYYSDNDGHMWVKLKNNGIKPLVVVAGDRIVQGIFVPFGITYDDCTVEKRIGGIGSSGK